MNNVEGLIRILFWLKGRDWGSAILLAFASLVVLAAIGATLPGTVPVVNALLESFVFRAGFYIGTIVLPHQTVGGHALFGLAADFLTLMGLWFACIRLLRWASAEYRSRPSKKY